jgi:KTSC domain
MPPRGRLGKPPTVPRAPRPIKVAKPPSSRGVNKALDDIVSKAKAEVRPTSRQARPRRSSVDQPANQARSRRQGNEMPSAAELLAGDHPMPSSGQQMPTAAELFEATASPMDALLEEAEIAERTKYLSPTASSMPERPRTLEAAYDPDRRVMRITFRSGGTYEYSGVPASIWYRFGRVKSPGKFLDANVIGQYPYEKVGAG